MPRYKLTLEYDGSSFAGWQRQEGQSTVQGVLEEAAARIRGEPGDVIGAGRTDSGVHALGQVAHFDLIRPLSIDKVRDALNANLRPHRVAILVAEEVEDGFHARFDAIGRSYLYRIVNRRPDLTFDHGRAWRVGAPLDPGRMHEAAQALLGRHDFTTFRDSQCQADSPWRTLDAISVSSSGDRIEVRCSARSFLHRQVRSMVGSLVDVGRGRQPVGWIEDILKAADRRMCGPVAPPDGLYLTSVRYADRLAGSVQSSSADQ
ncbi:MAG: tRNA pseudouridine(38-40) synthase TruA [Alphaproteobacteria bacterium]|nr:tRNA pseudouridine(38-40) synthase TruA [Alphaproteobacteria bacterium]